jgi:hypothetical protein
MMPKMPPVQQGVSVAPAAPIWPVFLGPQQTPPPTVPVQLPLLQHFQLVGHSQAPKQSCDPGGHLTSLHLPFLHRAGLQQVLPPQQTSPFLQQPVAPQHFSLFSQQWWGRPGGELFGS